MKNKSILIVGGAGYIGAHMTWLLEEKGYRPVVFDNLSTGRRDFVPKAVPFIKGDLRKIIDIERCFRQYDFDAVMHFAASISVPESVQNPIMYYENNVLGCINLLNVMLRAKVNKFIFSSTAAVYGEPTKIPIQEDDPTVPTNPYGWSKLMMEQMLRDVSQANGLRYVALRYFNAAGAHPSGKVGQWHPQVTNLIPSIMRVLRGSQKELLVYGDDYPTSDGTCIRDYIHVQDLCTAHLLALEKLCKGMESSVFNLGCGKGYSVLQVIETVKKVTQRAITMKVAKRRPGDPSRLVASSLKAGRLLNWHAERSLLDMVESAWGWEQRSTQ